MTTSTTTTERDHGCLVSLVLFCVANVLNVVDLIRRSRHREEDDTLWYALEPEHLRERWGRRASHRDARTAGRVLNAFAWFSLVIPVVRVSAVLSRGGRRKVGLHVLTVSLVLGASLTETLCRLVNVGTDRTLDWIADDFNLEDWGLKTTTDGNNDQTGRRVAEVLRLINRGVTLWVDAFEWLALGGIMMAVSYSLAAETADTGFSFPRRWGNLSFLVSLTSMFTFAANALNVDDHAMYAPVTVALTMLNSFVLLPAWLLRLSACLPEALTKRAVDAGAEELVLAPSPRRQEDDGDES